MTRAKMLYRRLSCHIGESDDRIRTRALFALGASSKKITASETSKILDAVIKAHHEAQKLAREFGL